MNRTATTANNRKYWASRFAALEQSSHDRGTEYINNLREQYDKAIAAMDEKVAAYYQRFANAEGVSLAEAKKMLTSSEAKRFKMNLKEYIAKGETLNYTQKWASELEKASDLVHISWYNALKMEMQQQVIQTYAGHEGAVADLLKKTYEADYYHTAYELQRGIGSVSNIRKINPKRINRLLEKPWAADGKIFSERIWRDREKLMKELPDVLTQGLILGENSAVTAKKLAERMDVKFSYAENLVRTESAFFSSEAKKDSFEKLGVKRYEIVATLDLRTSEICKTMDDKVFDIKDFKPGATAPPFHCRCRSTTCPHFDDEFTTGKTRAAMDPESGKTVQIPNMSYLEWYEKYVASTERGITKKRFPKSETANVDLEYIKSPEYSKKFSGMTNNSIQQIDWR